MSNYSFKLISSPPSLHDLNSSVQFINSLLLNVAGIRKLGVPFTGILFGNVDQAYNSLLQCHTSGLFVHVWFCSPRPYSSCSYIWGESQPCAKHNIPQEPVNLSKAGILQKRRAVSWHLILTEGSILRVLIQLQGI